LFVDLLCFIWLSLVLYIGIDSLIWFGLFYDNSLTANGTWLAGISFVLLFVVIVMGRTGLNTEIIKSIKIQKRVLALFIHQLAVFCFLLL
jgi:hypothetical protein